MERIETKHLIIGTGAMGAATAYHLARRGEPVLLIEQFALGHDRGSSHGAAHHSPFVRRRAVRPADARGVPGLERPGSRCRRASLHSHRWRFLLRPG